MSVKRPAKTFVGFGFGPIQVGLFVHKAVQSGAFERIVIGYRRADVVQQVRAAAGHIGLNIAHADRVEQMILGPIEIYNIYDENERDEFVKALSRADEVATALSSVADYTSINTSVSSTGTSVAAIFAAAFRLRAKTTPKPLIIYTAENHNHAAEQLQEAIWNKLQSTVSDAKLASLEGTTAFLNTVIGKMCGLIDTQNNPLMQLTPITPNRSQAFLVEAFDEILVSASPFERELALIEKPQLLPFEEAKLYGHNATHALAAYLAQVLEVADMADLRAVDGLMQWLFDAFVQESGAALICKYEGIDPLFTPQGYASYARDLLVRMTNPVLQDSSARVARDPKRKLGWNDRLIGTLRLALSQQVNGQQIDAGRYAFGCCAALDVLGEPYEMLETVWQPDSPENDEKLAVLHLMEVALQRYQQWQAENRPALDIWWQKVAS
ncbi:MAG: hypothetical protein AAF267_08900 [Deinococcota bacterium]